MYSDGHEVDGSWVLRVYVTDLQVERSLRVKGELHIGGVMLRLVEDLGECPTKSHLSLSLSLLVFLRFFLFPTLSSLPPDFLSKMWPLDSGLLRARIGCTRVPMRDRWNLNLPVARSVDSNFEAAGKMARMHRARLLIQS